MDTLVERLAEGRTLLDGYALFFIGAGLLRGEVFSRERLGVHRRFIVLGLLVGLPIVLLGMFGWALEPSVAEESDYDPPTVPDAWTEGFDCGPELSQERCETRLIRAAVVFLH